MRYCLYFICVLTLVLASCGGAGKTDDKVSADSLYSVRDSVLGKADMYPDTVIIRYAKGLKVDYLSEGVRVTVSDPDPSSAGESVSFIVKEPKKRFICMTALQLSNFIALGLEDDVVGMNSLRHIFNPRIVERMRDGKTLKIGKEGNFDLESVIASQPDYIFVSASKHGGYETLKECGIPLIPHHGYKETDPLGQAEWIKLIGLLTGEMRRANAVFDDIEMKYNTLKEEVRLLTENDNVKIPTVVSGRQIRSGWYVMGGNSYMARVFKDAGADYVMGDRQETGGVNMDFESVYAKAVDADFWQIDGSFDGEFSLKCLKAEDSRYADLSAFKEKHVLFCNFASTPYRELSPVEPHLLLADFVKAFHPEVLPHYSPKYYKLVGD